MNPIPIAESAIGGAIVELLKLATQDRRNFEQVFKKILAERLKAHGTLNKSIIDRTAETLLTDAEILSWLNSPQLPGDFPLLEKLSGKVSLDALFLQEFFLAFESAIAGNDRLNKILQNRRVGSGTQYLRDILRALSGQQTETQTQHDLAAIRRYCAKSRQRLILIRGLPGSGKTTLLRHLAHRYAGASEACVPVYLHLRNLNLNKTTLPDFVRE